MTFPAAMTPILKIIRRGKSIYMADYTEMETLMATCPSVDQASSVAHAIAGWHKVSLEEQDV